MKSFLLNKKNNTPIIKWGQIPDDYFFEGTVPEGYKLAVSPNDPYVILDIDCKEGKNGFDHIPPTILFDLRQHFMYNSNSGKHIWLKYTGNKALKNTSTKFGLDLRTSKGYVKWYLPGDIRDYIHQVKESNFELNEWLEKLFV